jgi:ppGpp synthetase/RelA/SpoT-type nucleotidyltranferase
VKTLEQAFSERQTILETVESAARSILDDFCKRRGFLLAGRAKSMESLRDKLETGRYADLDDVDGAIAFSIVIDTTSQESEVRKFIRKSFLVISVRSGTTLQDERTFDFDCTRIYCRLEDKLQLGNGIDRITVEIQIRTILQHAWSKITHPLVYKANIFDARAARLAAELMAQLESIDRSFSHFRTNSRSVKVVNRRDMIGSSALTAMIDQLVSDGVIPSEMRPSNGRRLGENIYSAIRRDLRHHYTKHIKTIKEFLEAQKGKFPRSVSLFQLAIVALYDANALDHGNADRPRRYYVTDELISLFPHAASIPNRVKIE